MGVGSITSARGPHKALGSTFNICGGSSGSEWHRGRSRRNAGVGFGRHRLDDGVHGVGGLTGAYCGVVSFIILKILYVMIGLRVSEQVETEGLDIAEHGNEGYASEVAAAGARVVGSESAGGG